MKFSFKQERFGDFSGGAVDGSPLANAGDTGSILVWEDPTCCGATKLEATTTEPEV